MGLHGRFPSYFYKRGNLFNTYLGYSDDQTLTTEKGVRRSTPTRVRTSGRQQNPPRPRPSQAAVEAGARLGRFARDHMSLAETERLFHLIAARAGVDIEWNVRRDARLPLALGQFIAQHVAPDEAANYLAVLEQRLERGEPLIRK